MPWLSISHAPRFEFHRRNFLLPGGRGSLHPNWPPTRRRSETAPRQVARASPSRTRGGSRTRMAGRPESRSDAAGSLRYLWRDHRRRLDRVLSAPRHAQQRRGRTRPALPLHLARRPWTTRGLHVGPEHAERDQAGVQAGRRSREAPGPIPLRGFQAVAVYRAVVAERQPASPPRSRSALLDRASPPA